MSTSLRWGSIRPSKSDAHWLETPTSTRPTATADRTSLGHSVDSAEFVDMTYKSDLSRESRDSSPPKNKLTFRDKGYTSLPAAGRPSTAPRQKIEDSSPGGEVESLSSLSIGRANAGANGERKVFLVAVQVVHAVLFLTITIVFALAMSVIESYVFDFQEYEKNLASLRRERDELKKLHQQQADTIADLNRYENSDTLIHH